MAESKWIRFIPRFGRNPQSWQPRLEHDMFQATSEQKKEWLGGRSCLHLEHATFQTAKEAWFSRQSEHVIFHSLGPGWCRTGKWRSRTKGVAAGWTDPRPLRVCRALDDSVRGGDPHSPRSPWGPFSVSAAR